MKNYFVLYQNISIDESLIGMKNRCVFIQYLPKKNHCRFGIKKFELCDSKASYIYNVSLNSGKDFLADGNDPFTQKVILNELSQSKLLDKGYHIFTDIIGTLSCLWLKNCGPENLYNWHRQQKH